MAFQHFLETQVLLIHRLMIKLLIIVHIFGSTATREQMTEGRENCIYISPSCYFLALMQEKIETNSKAEAHERPRVFPPLAVT